MNASRDIQALLAAFRIELPDPRVDLFSQMLGQFTVFPKLPIELRLKVWNLAFPAPRHVELVGPCVFGSTILATWSELGPKSRGKTHQKFNLLNRQFPVTLSINRESRCETLKHYSIIYIKADLAEELIQVCTCDQDEGCLKLPLWIDPRVDSVYLIPYLADDDMQDVLEYIEMNAPDVLPAIRTLEIQDMTVYAFNMGILQYFPGLDDLRFSSRTFASPEHVSRENNRFSAELEPYLQQQVEQGLRAKVPNVHFMENEY